MDKVFLKGMHFYGYHGVFPEERRLGQRFDVDLVLGVDLLAAGRQDDLTATINYADVFFAVEQVVTGDSVQLIEALAHRIAEVILRQFSCQTVRVKVTKPNPPIHGHYDAVGVEIERGRGDA